MITLVLVSDFHQRQTIYSFNTSPLYEVIRSISGRLGGVALLVSPDMGQQLNRLSQEHRNLTYTAHTAIIMKVSATIISCTIYEYVEDICDLFVAYMV